MSSVQTSRSERRLSDIAKHLVIPDGIVATGWPAVEDRAADFGITFDDWQCKVGQLALAKRENGRYAAGEGCVALSIPRQVGKTYLVGWTIFALASLQKKLVIVWTAHHTRTSNETFLSMQTMAQQPEVAPYIASVRASNGQQEVRFKSGSRILFGAREQGFGRGFQKVAILVFDEAQILTESALSDMVPATTRAENGLVWMIGTPPRPGKDPGEAFANVRQSAIEGDRTNLYIEFSADDDVTPAAWTSKTIDWDQVAKANPSFPRFVSRSAIRRMFAITGSPDAFRREALGVWDSEVVNRALSAAGWAQCQVDTTTSIESDVCFGVKFAVDGSMVAVAAAAKTGDDSDRILVDGVRQVSAGEGVSWLVEFLADPERLSRTVKIVVEGKSGAGYLVDQLRRAGVRKATIVTPTVDQAVTAHAMFMDAVKAGAVAHWGGDELSRQVGLARIRKIGNRGGFGWAAPDDDTVALLDAATFAYWVCASSRKKRAGGGVTIL